MDDKLDHGGIIVREIVEKYLWDTSLTLYNRVLEKEIELFEKNFDSIINNNYKITQPNEKGNIFFKKDFNKLLKLDLQEEGTFKYFYDKLRALSHGDYKNAYFIDEESGEKIYVKLEVSKERMRND